MGEYHPSLDEKGRAAIPAKLRRAFGENSVINRLIITHGFDKCIMAFREEDWKNFVEEKLIKLSQADSANRQRIRFLLGGACDCELDKQGRIIIPGYLLDYARITKDITVLGVYDRLEIWAREVYDQYRPDAGAVDSFAGDLGF
ncbi:MAG TPA: division/cell wall cluster transcriptional repressor MraZ [Spirochaetota bacterium]|nr:division/cell wall cluster transcriptional repressor MraZ [Spirochaetota bacterium]HPI89858.1 division/cell wall cluster transcriptional repressor MraZ [Spirochaetota bacterium]HPR48629.1 division/cell wall cluster transcriptional repressor MraZ [Spirochaetota bacterium]